MLQEYNHTVTSTQEKPLRFTVAVTKKFTFFIMPLPLHSLTVTVQGRAVTVPIKITYITLSDNEHRAF